MQPRFARTCRPDRRIRAQAFCLDLHAALELLAALDILRGFYEKATARIQDGQASLGLKVYMDYVDAGVMGMMQTITTDPRTRARSHPRRGGRPEGI